MVAVLLGNVDKKSESLLNAFCLSPFAGVKLASGALAVYEQNFRAMSLAKYWVPVNYFTFGSFVIITLMWIVVLFLLGIYLELVVPSEYGTKKHPLFCFKKKVTPEIFVHPDGQEQYQKLGSDPKYLEQVEAELLIQNEQGKSLTIKNLRKQYTNGKVAVEK